MTEPLFFDTDCLSAFLWINEQSILAQLYPGRIVIPQAVYEELSYPKVSHLKARIDDMLCNSYATVSTIQSGTKEYKMYRMMTTDPFFGHKIIGKGEASAISMAKFRGGIVASNNLKDVSSYVNELNLELKTTGDIMKDALEKGLITEEEGNNLWQEMLSKRRRLGYVSFTDYLEKNR